MRGNIGPARLRLSYGKHSHLIQNKQIFAWRFSKRKQQVTQQYGVVGLNERQAAKRRAFWTVWSAATSTSGFAPLLVWADLMAVIDSGTIPKPETTRSWHFPAEIRHGDGGFMPVPAIYTNGEVSLLETPLEISEGEADFVLV